MKKAYVFDIEADNLLPDATKIHYICLQQVDLDTRKLIGVTTGYKGAGIDEAVAILSNADVLIGHNITGYDLPLLTKFYPELFNHKTWFKKGIYDTMLASQLIYPNEPGAHSIEAWAIRRGMSFTKVKVEDFSKLTGEMVKRCANDVGISAEIYRVLKGLEWDKFEKHMEIESKVALIHALQVQNGVHYNTEKAVALLRTFDKEREEIRRKLIAEAPPSIKPYGALVSEPFKKDGDFKKMVIDWWGKEWLSKSVPKIRGPFMRIKYEPFNPDSPKQVTDFLLSQGWKPTEWNFVREPDGTMRKTSPKITEDSWGSLPKGLGELIGRYRMLSHRRRLIQNDKDPTLGSLAQVRKDGRVPAEAITCGTPTFRYRHTKAVCNIPRPSTPFGKEIRKLFGVERSYADMVGFDLKGIEARMLAHYIMPYPGGPELAKIIVEEDYHAYNAKNWKCTREEAKSGLYALIYGCGPAKLASTLNKPITQGHRLFNIFWKANIPVKILIDNLELAYAKGESILTIDGRVLDIRQKRLILNTLLQGSAAVIFKTWMVANYYHIVHTFKVPNLFFQIIAYHDELQYESKVTSELRDDIINKIKDNAQYVGKYYRIKVPVLADVKVGKNWAECH